MNKYRVHSLLQGQHLLRVSVKTIGIRYSNKKDDSPFKEYEEPAIQLKDIFIAEENHE